ncbi:alpha/beta hydrolase [Protaetiibacter sp. SSC-01]|uniref:alpha/beta fold hydrolase n=1 Tax=Protaetiibacter sp. SSC-01 TaxID=2759943 RepID=UPI001656D6FF|nr:alpha/beta hydrolase [Protaetiibacter sp. SSC-01]QNO37614.1 alpha/beta hydrolase [Protaetiibacter sp. SSC-01]
MSTTPQTIVLVHGAFAESASWNGVIPRLQQAGHRVIAVANPLRGLASDAAYVRSLLESIDGDVVVAGHSYGGSVASEATAGLPNVSALVFVASFLLEPGESTGELAGRFPGNLLGTALAPVPYRTGETSGDDLYIVDEKFNEIFAGDVDGETAALMAATQRPIAAQALADTATQAAWTDTPSWSVIATQDLAVPLEASRFMAERAGATAVEIDASHAITVSQPEAVAEVILEAARSTVRSAVR